MICFSAVLYKVCLLCCFLCFFYLDSHFLHFSPLVPLSLFFMSSSFHLFTHPIIFFSFFLFKINCLFFFPFCISVIDVLPLSLSLCLAFICCSVLLQLSVSQSTYDSQTSDELSANQSMSFSPSNSAQHSSCFNPGPSSAHSNTGANRQVSVGGWKRNISLGPGYQLFGCQL